MLVAIGVIGGIIGAVSGGDDTSTPSAPEVVESEVVESEVVESEVVESEVVESEVVEPERTSESSETFSQQQARESARSYLNFTSFSRSGLIDQLEFEGYSTSDATYGVDAQNADWNAQAAETARDYLEYSSFSRSGLIDQLVFEGFTLQQATYGVNAAGL